jgi:hypothetical protein
MVIYKTTNLINNKIYIGQDKNNNPNYLGSGKKLKRAVKKYGKNNFLKEVIEVCDSEEMLNEREIFWILYYKSTDRKIGYNISDGSKEGDRKLGYNSLIKKGRYKTWLEKYGKEEADKKHREWKQKISEYQKNWRENNPDKAKRYTRKTYLNRVIRLGREEIRRKSREEYWKNVSKKRAELRKSYQKHSDKRKEYAKKYKKKNPHWNRMHESNRRARKLRAFPPWLSETHKYQIQLMSELARNLEKETGVKYHVDHIHPLKHENLCGLHVPWNLQVIPESENISKSNKFIPELGLTAC